MIHHRSSTLTWMRRTALAAVLLAFAVVILGAWVRRNTAGLGCPDWPGCYGHLTPLGAQAGIAAGATDPGHTSLIMGRAWKEMIHRYCAGTLVLLIVALTVMTFLQRRARAVGGSGVPYVIGLLALVLAQALLGMLTVTWRVAPQIVTLHLLCGLGTLGLLWWLWLGLREQSPHAARTSFGRQASMGWEKSYGVARRLALIALGVLVIQIFLGGWTSTNYAALACTDFPTCQTAWWPPRMDFASAFQLWHPPTTNYEGGVLASAARIAIHFTHRLGAVVTTLTLLLAAAWVLRERGLARERWPALAVLGAVALQLLIGIAMVVEGFPLWLATAHNGGAALTLLAVLALNFRLRHLAPRA